MNAKHWKVFTNAFAPVVLRNSFATGEIINTVRELNCYRLPNCCNFAAFVFDLGG